MVSRIDRFFRINGSQSKLCLLLVTLANLILKALQNNREMEKKRNFFLRKNYTKYAIRAKGSLLLCGIAVNGSTEG